MLSKESKIITPENGHFYVAYGAAIKSKQDQVTKYDLIVSQINNTTLQINHS